MLLHMHATLLTKTLTFLVKSSLYEADGTIIILPVILYHPQKINRQKKPNISVKEIHFRYYTDTRLVYLVDWLVDWLLKYLFCCVIRHFEVAHRQCTTGRSQRSPTIERAVHRCQLGLSDLFPVRSVAQPDPGGHNKAVWTGPSPSPRPGSPLLDLIKHTHRNLTMTWIAIWWFTNKYAWFIFCSTHTT